MNLFEFIAICGIVLGLVLGFGAGIAKGAWAAIAGAFLGAAVAYVSWVAAMMVLFALLYLFLLYRPMFPRCRSGRCRDADYTYLYLDVEATGEHKRLQDSMMGKLLRCKCGGLYLDSLRDRRFYEVLDDSSLAAYMRYRPFGRWQPDQGERQLP
jgi:hypothetical protein